MNRLRVTVTTVWRQILDIHKTNLRNIDEKGSHLMYGIINGRNVGTNYITRRNKSKVILGSVYLSVCFWLLVNMNQNNVKEFLKIMFLTIRDMLTVRDNINCQGQANCQGQVYRQGHDNCCENAN